MKRFGLILCCAVLLTTVEPIRARAALSGDINCDGSLSIADAVELCKIVAESSNSMRCDADTADMDADALVTAADVAKLLEMLASMSILTAIEEKGTVHTGFATFYGGGYEGGCAMLDPISREDYWITAMNLPDWNGSRMAGAFLEVTGELGTIQVLVTDLLPEGAKGDLDLYVDAFPLIAPAEKGKVPVSWKIIPLDTAADAPVSYVYKEGSSAFWCGVQVRNHRYPIEKLEYLDAETGEFITLERRNYNFFESREMGAGPFTFRLTDIYGQVIVDENIPLTPNEQQTGHVQFPL